MRKIISLLCCLVMIATTCGAFVGCGCGGDDANYVLTIGYDNGGYGLQWLEHAVEKFCAANNIDKDSVYIEAEKNYTDTVRDKLSNDTQIRDLLIISGNSSREWAAFGWLEPLDSVLFNTTLSSGKTVAASLTDPTKIDVGHINGARGDHYYAFPTDSGAWGIYYNKTMFEQNGWEVPETYDDLLALCETIVQSQTGVPENDRIYPFVCSTDITKYWDFLVQNWVVQLIGIDAFREFCKLENADVYSVNSVCGQAKIKALDAWSKIAIEKGERYVVSDSASFLAAQILFAQGKIAMMPNGNWFENEIKASLPDNVEIALMPTPYIDGAKKDSAGNYIKVNYGGNASGWVIPAKAKHKDLAKQFLVFMAEEQQLKDYLLDSGGMLPYECDYSDVVDKLTVCQKSVYDMVNGAQSFGFLSTNPIVYGGISIGFWLKGLPYSRMLTSNTPITSRMIVQDEQDYATSEWENFIRRSQQA